MIKMSIIVLFAISLIAYFICVVAVIDRFIFIEDKEMNIIRFIISALPIVNLIYAWPVLKRRNWWEKQFKN